MFGSKRANIQEYSTAEEGVYISVCLHVCVCLCDLCTMVGLGQKEVDEGEVSKLQGLYNKES